MKIKDDEFPFGDWLRASPMKAVNVMTPNGSGTRDNLRRSLFIKEEQIKGKLEEVPEEEKTKEHDPHIMNQLNALMDSMGKVGVSTKESAIQGKISPNPSKIQVVNHYNEENHGVVQSCRRNQ